MGTFNEIYIISLIIYVTDLIKQLLDTLKSTQNGATYKPVP